MTILLQNYTKQQNLVVVGNAPMFVYACPGAGKTQTLVARVRDLLERLSSQKRNSRRGVAVLSFTRSAVEEFMGRFSQSGAREQIVWPSVVSTFDSFINHFIVIPGGIPGCDASVRIVDDYSRIEISVSKAKMSPLSLKSFDPLNGTLVLSSVDVKSRPEAEKHRPQLEKEARRVLERLRRKGVINATIARNIAYERLCDENFANALGESLSLRFEEIIVDEAQDCNEQDICVLQWLRDAGIPLTVVCDPDQAIYEFRGSQPSRLSEFASTLRTSVHLEDNFRSSPAVCALAATLRDRPQADHARGPTKDISIPIKLIFYKKLTPDIGRVFGESVLSEKLLDTESLMSESIIMAHTFAHSAKAAGGSLLESPTHRVMKMAIAVTEYSDPASRQKERSKALRFIQCQIFEHMTGESIEDHDLEHAMERFSLSARALIERSVMWAHELWPSAKCRDKDGFCAALKRLHQRLNPKTDKYISPPSKTWEKFNTPAQSTAMQYATIHESKGREYEAVCIVIPPDHKGRLTELLSSWRDRTNSEGKRVLYVGVTRAKCLCTLALPMQCKGLVLEILRAGTVPYKITAELAH